MQKRGVEGFDRHAWRAAPPRTCDQGEGAGKVFVSSPSMIAVVALLGGAFPRSIIFLSSG